jgi:alpha-glucosidase
MTQITQTQAADSSFAWWQRGVVYQIYPRSFQDSNGDGVGDLAGITARLDYLRWLGVDAIWLSPVNPSPMADFGYDVSDYTDIDPLFGSLADFDALLAETHRRGMKLIVDFVPNHTSEQHPWFLESRSSRNNAKRDWYIWRDAGPDGGPPNNWLSEFGGPAWTHDNASGQYYYHAYLPQQPDLNWRNPDVRAAMFDAMRFWLDRGVDGFRLDTIHHLFEDEALRDNPPNPDFKPGMAPTLTFLRQRQVDLPEVQEVLAAMRRMTNSYPDRVLIGEAYLPLANIMAYYGDCHDEAKARVHLPFNFHLIGAPWRASFIADLIAQYESLLPQAAWPNWVLGNHDRARIASRVGAAQAPLATMLLLTLRGTPTLYYGDELGLTDVAIPPERVQDPWELRVPGFDFGRDPVRTPMPWDGQEGAGFTTGTPWLPFNPDLATRNVEAQRNDSNSMLRLTRDLLALRHRIPALAVGAYGIVESRGDILVFERIPPDGQSEGRITVMLNFAGSTVYTAITRGRVMISSGGGRAGEIISNLVCLRPHEGLVIENIEGTEAL